MQNHEESIYWIQDVENPTHGWRATKTSLHNQGYGRGELSVHQCWVPKAAYANLPTHFQQKYPAAATKKPQPKSAKTNPPQQQTKVPTKKMWVPKYQKPSNASTKPPQCTNATRRWIPKSEASPTNTQCAAKAPRKMQIRTSIR